MGAVTLVLLIACANIANLLIARASVRQRRSRSAPRSAPGRWRIVRQLLTEAILLGLMAAPIGMALAVVGLRWLDSAIPPDDIPLLHPLGGRSPRDDLHDHRRDRDRHHLRPRPGVPGDAANLHESLKEGSGTGGQGRRAWLRNTLVVVEVAASLVLLMGASLFVRSFQNLQKRDAGFEAAPLMTMRFFLTGDAYQTPESRALRTVDIVRRVESLPGVRAAFASNLIPLGGGGGGGARPSRAGAFRRARSRTSASRPSRRTYRTLGRVAFCAAAISPMPKQRRSAARDRQRDDGETALAESGCARPPIQGGGDGHRRRVVHGHRRRRRLLPQRDGRPGSAVPVRLRAHGWMATPNTGLTIRVDGDPAKITGGRARRHPRGRSEHPAVPDPDDGRAQAARLLAVRPLRRDVLDVRGRGAVPRVDRRLRRAVVRGVAADAGDRRPRRARRGPRRRAAAGRRPGPQAGRHRHPRRAHPSPCRRTSSSSRFCS